MKFNIITTFPKIFDSYFNESIIKRAQDTGKVKITTHDLRNYTADKHKTVDDKPFGGGAGMVLKVEPILKAMDHVTRSIKYGAKKKIIILSAKGKQFTQKMAYSWSKEYSQIIFVSGRYEGIDERAVKILKADEVCIGPYVLTDGDVAVMAIVSAITRLIPGVIKFESLQEESFWKDILSKEKNIGSKNLIPNTYNLEPEYPHYTRPEVLEWKGRKYRVPKVLLSGNHKEVSEWRAKHRTRNI